MDVLMQSCPTKIYLPNRQARDDDEYAFYRGCGLNDRQIGILAHAVPKRDYYMVNPSGRRLFQLGLGPVALSFVGVSDKDSIARIRTLRTQHGAEWPRIWLRERNLEGNIR